MEETKPVKQKMKEKTENKKVDENKKPVKKVEHQNYNKLEKKKELHTEIKPEQKQVKEEPIKKPEDKIKIEEKKELPSPEIKKETETKIEEKSEIKKEEKKEGKTDKTQKEQKKWTEASVYLKDVPVSTKYAVAICNFIKKKNPEKAIEFLEKVLKKEKAIYMKGEFPHKKGMPKGMPSGKYPVKATEYFIKALKNLIANAKVKLLDTEKLYVYSAEANQAARHIKATRLAFGPKKFKRSHIWIGVKEK